MYVCLRKKGFLYPVYKPYGLILIACLCILLVRASDLPSLYELLEE